MKKLLKSVVIMAALVGVLLVVNVPKGEAEGYTLKVESFSNLDKSLSYTITNYDSNIDQVIAEVDGERYSDDVYDQNGFIDFDRTFKSGTQIKLYISYYNTDYQITETYIRTITVSEKEPPKLNATLKVDTFSSKDEMLFFTITDYNSNDFEIDEVIAEVNGKRYSDYVYGDTGLIDFDNTFKAGTKIKLYLKYYNKDNYDNDEFEDYIQTITVLDKTPPKLSVSSIDTRTKTVNITTEVNAIVTATYGGKSIKVTKRNSTSYKITLNKPLLGKKLIVTAKDAAGNSSKSTKNTSKPSGVSISLNTVVTKTRTATGTVKKAISTDQVYFIVGTKKYKGKIKGSKYSVKIPGIKARKYVKVQLVDKYGNILATSSSKRVYTSKYVSIGMTKNQVLDTEWGSPDDINKDIYKNYTWEQWVYYYSDYEAQYLYFENGKLVSISE